MPNEHAAAVRRPTYVAYNTNHVCYHEWGRRCCIITCRDYMYDTMANHLRPDVPMEWKMNEDNREWTNLSGNVKSQNNIYWEKTMEKTINHSRSARSYTHTWLFGQNAIIAILIYDHVMWWCHCHAYWDCKFPIG